MKNNKFVLQVFPRFFLMVAILAASLALSSCGGDANSTNTSKASGASGLRQAIAITNRSAADYNFVTEQVYLAYFGRPADPAGLQFYSDAMLRAAVPTNVVELSRAYDSNASLRAIIDSFGNSQESMDLYPGDNTSFVTAIYHNLFSREPDAGGLAFWVGLLDTRQITRARAAISLMAGAQSTDIDVITKKTQVGANFTRGITTGYDTLDAALSARQMLANVVLTTDVTAFQTTVDATLAALVAQAARNNYPQVAAIIKTRCTVCHSVTPTFPGFSRAPRGVTYDTSEEIHAAAQSINQVAGTSSFMPFNNATNMSSDERAVIRTWIALGAP